MCADHCRCDRSRRLIPRGDYDYIVTEEGLGDSSECVSLQDGVHSSCTPGSKLRSPPPSIESVPWDGDSEASSFEANLRLSVQGHYTAGGCLRVIMASRRRLVREQVSATVREDALPIGNAGGPGGDCATTGGRRAAVSDTVATTVPCDLFDLSFCKPCARVEESDGQPRVSFSGREVIATLGEVEKIVASTSDLFLAPWAGTPIRERQARVAPARRLIAEFIGLVNEGSITLVSETSQSGVDGWREVVFDVPIPAVARAEGWGTIKPMSYTRGMWKSETKAVFKLWGPAWLTEEVIVPQWWPECVEGSWMLFPPAFHDGTEKSAVEVMDCKEDTVVKLRCGFGWLKVYGYVSDLMDRRIDGVWIDIDAVSKLELVRRRGAYVIGSDGHSSLLTATQVSMLSKVVESKPACVDLEQGGQYPRHSICRRVLRSAKLVPNRKLEAVGNASQVGVSTALAAAVMMPYHMRLSTDQGCFYELFRPTYIDGEIALGRVQGRLALAGRLLDPDTSRLRLALSESYVAVKGQHIDLSDMRTAGRDEDLDNLFGQDIKSWNQAPMMGTQALALVPDHVT